MASQCILMSLSRGGHQILTPKDNVSSEGARGAHVPGSVCSTRLAASRLAAFSAYHSFKLNLNTLMTVLFGLGQPTPQSTPYSRWDSYSMCPFGLVP